MNEFIAKAEIIYTDEAGWGTFRVPIDLEEEFMEFIHRYEMTDDYTDEELDRWEEYRIA
jgi:hypothetical protein